MNASDPELFRREARAWLATQELPAATDDSDQRFNDLRDWQRRLWKAGWLGLSWPQDSGGRGLSHLHQVIFNQELASARAPRPAGVVGIEIVGPTILRFGNESQHRDRLPRVLSGEDIWCQGFSEPEAGSDLASLRTSARQIPGGWVINGHKVWTTWSHKANWCAVLARTDPTSPKHRGISYFLVPLNLPGVTVRPLRQLNGDNEFGEVLFEDVHVEAESLVGEVNSGWSYAMHTLSSERGSFVLRRTADLSVALADLISQLVSGGSDITDFEAHRLGELKADLFALQSQGERILDRLMTAPDEPSGEDSLDKAYLTHVEQHLFGFARDCLGPYAQLADQHFRGLDTGRWMHDYYFSRAASIFGGTAQVQRNIIAERLLGLPRELRP
jgi:alkylation response protein AidB-like acyl-CoA dehydrogenase